jgi:hypothetical protein
MGRWLYNVRKLIAVAAAQNGARATLLTICTASRLPPSPSPRALHVQSARRVESG